MTTSREHLEKFSREDLIAEIQKLEDSLAEAAKGLMTEGSAQELAALKLQYQKVCLERDDHWRSLQEKRLQIKESNTLIEQLIDEKDAVKHDLSALREHSFRLPGLLRWWYGS